MKRMMVVCGFFLVSGGLFLSADFAALAQSGPPPLPTDPLLEVFEFSTNFDTLYGYSPVAYTNISSMPVWRGDALVLEMSNAVPAFLEYNLVETNGYANLSFSNGTIILLVAPDWASADTNQYGTGPGQTAYFLGAGDWTTGSPNGFFGLSADLHGTNLVLWGMSNGVATAYVNTAISWSSNAWHILDAEYSPSNSFLYVDGALAATGAGVTVIPGTNTWTNGLWIGSDNTGFEQIRGALWHTEIWGVQWGGLIDTNGWSYLLNEITTWQGSLGGGGFGMMMGMSGGTLTPNGSSTNCITGTNPYLTNIVATLTNGPSIIFTFTIEGGIPAIPYDIFTATNLVGDPATNSPWTWLGQGTNCGTYYVTNQAPNASFYILGGTNLATDGSGFTTAYESLVIQANPFNADSGSPGMPVGWAFSLGLIPSYNYLANSGQRINYTYDPVGRLDLVTGIRSETVTNDPEGNVLSAH